MRPRTWKRRVRTRDVLDRVDLKERSPLLASDRCAVSRLFG